MIIYHQVEADVVPLVDKGAKFLQGDVLDVDTLREFSKYVDVIIHLVSKSDVKESVINLEVTNKVNVGVTTNVLQWHIKNKIKKIIFASSAAVYGDSKEISIIENSKTNSQSLYDKSKLDAEKIIKKNLSRE